MLSVRSERRRASRPNVVAASHQERQPQSLPGASGFLLKDAPSEQLVAGIRAVAEGESLLAPAITRRLIKSFMRNLPRPLEPAPGLDELSQREREVFRLLARGLSNAEIATELFLSSTTVKSHVARVLSKLGLRDRVQAVVLAYETGIITPGEAKPG
jgi:DNA-binding NarL/FixJ family response regulator